MDAVDEIKSKIRIEDIVAQYVPLKKAGRNFKACCPFHSEKTPSFVVSPDKQLAYCFGCNKGGDIFKFVEEIEGVDFTEALRILADKSGVDLADYQLKGVLTPGKKDIKERLYLLHEKVALFYSEKLFGKEGGKVLKYLENRGFNNETIKHFRLGYAPSSFEDTYLYLLNEGFTKNEIVSAGLAILKDTEGDKIYDRFRRRLIFPIRNPEGKVIAFGGRSLAKEDNPKYLNSPDTPIYHKGKAVYGYFYAKRSIRENDSVVIVEGYMDVMASSQAGVENVVASSGTSLSVPQLKLLGRQTKNLNFSFDVDNAGIMAGKRAIEVAQGMDVNIKVIQVPEGKDPDECIRENKDLWIKAIGSAVPYFDFLLREAQGRVDLSTIEGKKIFLADLLPTIKKVESRLEQDEYLKKMSFVLNTKEEILYEEMKRVKDSFVDAYNSEQKKVEVSLGESRFFSSEERLIGVLYAFPESLSDIKLLELDSYWGIKLKNIYTQLVKHYNDRAEFDREGFLQSLDEKEKEEVEVFGLLAEEKNQSLDFSAVLKEADALAKRIKSDLDKNKRKDLLSQIKEARKIGETTSAKDLLKVYQDMIDSKERK